ncbi:restriction endonuclease subunit S [Odoribacter splanchnicus]|uniref:restriction endonuclease subunit S n=1 Tax=Odoribacter splanchnicus TaxID=28118 RepID=UPI001C3857FC|nr:restriction endonuclease subunit S [Odoribacter splanchnicus]MBV4275689.1 restriction endonuclease subunit S [Odoribacter splanchnicus]
MDTKALRQKILDLAIHGKLVPQDPNDEPASVLLERIKAEKERLIKEGKIKRSKKSAKTSDTPHYENVPFEVPNNWVWTTLGEIFNLQAGKNITAKDIFTRQDTDHRFPCYGGNGLRGYVSSYNREGHFPLIGRQGALCGNINEANGQFYATEHAIVVDTHCETNIDWAINVLLYLNLNQYATSTAQPGLSVGTINEVMIPVPPLEEQQRISQRINDWFALIDKIEQGKADLQVTIKQAKNKILDLSIHGKLVPQEPNDEPASELLKRINPKAENTCDNGHYTQLPEGWQIAPMQTLCKLTDGEKQTGIERIYLDVKYLRGEREAKTMISGKFVAANALLILVDGENSGEVFQTPIDGYQGSTFKQLLINGNMNEEYVLLVINMHRKILRESKVGSAIPHLNKKLFKAIEVPIPPYHQQKRIVEAINIMFKHLDIIMESL